MSDFDVAPPVVELVPVPDTFCSGVGAIENIGAGLLRVYLYATQGSACGEGPLERVLVAKLIVPAAAVPDMILRARAAISDKTAKAATSALVN
jgi:hypothetical protein